MADPRTELADIVVPLAPETVVAAAGSHLGLWAAAGLAAVAGFALFAWLWRRRPARALRAIAAAAAQRQFSVPGLAARLDAWAREYFRLARVDATRCPPGLDPVAWCDWATTLGQLRFGPPQPDGFECLLALCESVRAWGRHA